jgi:hypothetical protein
MIINELEGFYGKATEDEKQWIAGNLEKLDADLQGKFLSELHKIHKDSKFPDISIMKNLLVRVTGKQPKQYIWAVCLECGCEYDYGLPMCPACYDKGLDCRARAVKKSEFQPPMKVIKYNKQYQNGDKGETVCYNCVHKSGSFCKNFGNPNWNCHREEFESCNCARCCAVAKRYNAELEKSRSENKISYAMPLKGEK